jgi:hypothetical protein
MLMHLGTQETKVVGRLFVSLVLMLGTALVITPVADAKADVEVDIDGDVGGDGTIVCIRPPKCTFCKR